MIAPDSLSPKMSEAWFFSSLKTKHPGDKSVGIFKELVANPIPHVVASSTPKNSAVNLSNSRCSGQVPYSARVDPKANPYFLIDSMAASALGPLFSANPR